MQQITARNILGIDVGERRIGIAMANTIARLPRPLTTLYNNASFWDKLMELIRQEDVAHIVVGLPRGLQGQDTAQTDVVRAFVEDLKQHVSVPVSLQDEALTSRQAEAELNARKKRLTKEDIDALAATYILDDYLRANPGGGV
jgi:putative Holliday junction resolvase